MAALPGYAQTLTSTATHLKTQALLQIGDVGQDFTANILQLKSLNLLMKAAYYQKKLNIFEKDSKCSGVYSKSFR